MLLMIKRYDFTFHFRYIKSNFTLSRQLTSSLTTQPMLLCVVFEHLRKVYLLKSFQIVLHMVGQLAKS